MDISSGWTTCVCTTPNWVLEMMCNFHGYIMLLLLIYGIKFLGLNEKSLFEFYFTYPFKCSLYQCEEISGFKYSLTCVKKVEYLYMHEKMLTI